MEESSKELEEVGGVLQRSKSKGTRASYGCCVPVREERRNVTIKQQQLEYNI